MTFARLKRLAGLVALLAALTFALAACGGGDDEEGEGAATEATGGAEERAFPELKIAFDDGTDYLDPGLSYTVQGWTIMWRIHLGLLSYKGVNGPEGAELVPALAEDLPEVSEDGLTYRFTLREGLKYSDGKPVNASDFKYTIERLYKIDSPGVGFFSGIVGAEQFAKTKKGSLTGIVTDDAERSIEIRLTKPQGDFMHILAMIFAGVVPTGTPASDQSTKKIPATGPYLVESYTPNQRIVISRNPNWEEIEGIPNGNPDSLTFEVFTDESAAVQSVIDNNNDYDFVAIPVDRLGDVQQTYGDRLKLYVPANTGYFFVNTRTPPFDKLEVRQAVNYAIDRQAMTRLYGGLAQPTENVLPPTYPQYEKISMYPHDLEKAKQLVQQAGAAGAAVTAWGSSRDISRKPVEYLVDILNQIGLKAKLKIIDPSIYWSTIGNQKTKAQIGFANWFQDYPHPLNWFDTLLNGNRITEEHNNNYSNADVAEINAKIEELKKEPELTDEINQEWAEVDRLVAENALWVPYNNRQFTDFFSESVDLENCYVSHVLYQFDWYQSCKKS